MTRVLCLLLAGLATVLAQTTTTTSNTGFDLTAEKKMLPCYLLGQRDQIAANKSTPSRSITKRADHKQKPFPSLTQCYRYNTFACCVSGHDTKIKSDYENLLSTTCLREYEALENYYCLGCDPEQGKYTKVYTDHECASNPAACPYYNIANPEQYGCKASGCDGHLYLCGNYVYKKLFPDCSQIVSEKDCTETRSNKCCWHGNKCHNGKQSTTEVGAYETKVYTCDNPTTVDNWHEDGEAWAARSIYDGCGLNVNDEYRLPSFWFQNSTEFVNVIKPPYFDNFAVVIRQESEFVANANDIDSACYTSGAAKVASTFFALILSAVAAMAMIL